MTSPSDGGGQGRTRTSDKTQWKLPEGTTFATTKGTAGESTAEAEETDAIGKGTTPERAVKPEEDKEVGAEETHETGTEGTTENSTEEGNEPEEEEAKRPGGPTEEDDDGPTKESTKRNGLRNEFMGHCGRARDGGLSA